LTFFPSFFLLFLSWSLLPCVFQDVLVYPQDSLAFFPVVTPLRPPFPLIKNAKEYRSAFFPPYFLRPFFGGGAMVLNSHRRFFGFPLPPYLGVSYDQIEPLPPFFSSFSPSINDKVEILPLVLRFSSYFFFFSWQRFACRTQILIFVRC